MQDGAELFMMISPHRCEKKNSMQKCSALFSDWKKVDKHFKISIKIIQNFLSRRLRFRSLDSYLGSLYKTRFLGQI